ncbi:MAG TPA: hypothetical protein VGK37_00445 [Casimicrobiaceae bacterium]
MSMLHQIMPMTVGRDRLEALSLEAQRWLAGARTALADQIRAYPTPIPRCDAQFNHLLEQRTVLSCLLSELDIALCRAGGGNALRDFLAGLIALPSFGDSVDERRLRESIAVALRRN